LGARPEIFGLIGCVKTFCYVVEVTTTKENQIANTAKFAIRKQREPVKAQLQI